MLDVIEIEGRTVTEEALFTQRDLAQYLVEERERGTNYHFTVKGNQSALLEAIAFFFQPRQKKSWAVSGTGSAQSV
ncbi:MAG: hypothetical protein KZQ60_08020 [Candidatus Thiodiazotropha sp. (ex Lucinoma aequizonata)]|nr:hypothetical protein [Candidatus Thiodiazotropha sp. (ex Lucinoma aequizonata)]